MITHDELTDMMAARLSKGEDLDLIYTNPKNHIVCFIPTYEPGGGDSTKYAGAGGTGRVEAQLHYDQRRSA